MERLLAGVGLTNRASCSTDVSPHLVDCWLTQAQVLEADDPRVAWDAQNRAALQQREQAEAAKKVELLSAAKEYLDKVYKVCKFFVEMDHM
jgi:hypothetical protein